jgi:hypothetical protein
MDLAASARPLPGHFRVAATMIRPVQLHDRLRAILDDGRARQISGVGAAAAAVLAVVLLGAVAGFTPTPGTTSAVQAAAPSEAIPTADASLEAGSARFPAPAPAVSPEIVQASARAASRDREPDRVMDPLRDEVAARKPTIFVDVVPLQSGLLQGDIDADRIEPIEAIGGPTAVQGDGPGEQEGAPATIHVKNQNFQDATLWLVSRGGRVRLGAVTGKADASFTTPVTGPGDVWRVQIDLVGGEWCETRPLAVDPGDELDLLVSVDVSNLPECYPAGVRPEP